MKKSQARSSIVMMLILIFNIGLAVYFRLNGSKLILAVSIVFAVFCVLMIALGIKNGIYDKIIISENGITHIKFFTKETTVILWENIKNMIEQPMASGPYFLVVTDIIVNEKQLVFSIDKNKKITERIVKYYPLKDDELIDTLEILDS